MSGALSQLVAIGAQNDYITVNATITFFKTLYRKHTNFACEMIVNSLSGNTNFGKKANVILNRSGDLVTNMYVKASLPAVTTSNFSGYVSGTSTTQFAWVRRPGHVLLKTMEITIGGASVDKHYSTWLNLFYELTHKQEQERGYCQMIGDIPELTKLRGADSQGYFTRQKDLIIPLQFWFNRNPGLALPLIALQYHDIRFEVEFETAEKMCVYTGTVAPSGLALANAELLVNYVYLDQDERLKFAQRAHEYLIDQLQFTGSTSITGADTGFSQAITLTFSHPCKELVFAVQSALWTQGKTYLAYTHDDDMWEAAGGAVDQAAKKLAFGMFGLETAASSSAVYVVSTGKLNVNYDGAYYTNSTNATGTVVPNSITNKVYVTVVVSDGVTADATNGFGNLARSTTYKSLVLRQNALGSTSYGLGDRIQQVVIYISETAATTFEISNIDVKEHSLTVRDISIPIVAMTDNRYTTNNTSLYFEQDVVVYQWHNFGAALDGKGNPLATGLLQFNGKERFSVQKGDYFNYVEPHRTHTHTPCDGVNVYSFALNPEMHQPSGTANLSRIDKNILQLTFSDPSYLSGLNMISLGLLTSADFYCFATSYNIFRVISGLGGVAYAN